MLALVNEAEAKRLTASQELSEIPQWVAWKYLPALPSSRTGKPRKVPVDPKNGGAAKVNDPFTWASFDAAFERARKDRLSGVGFVLRRENDLTMIDLDGCIDESGQLEPWAAEIVALGETYTEVSPSGRGLRMFARGALAHAVAASDFGVEMYSEARYCTVTGKRRPESPLTINEAPRTIEALKARVEAHKRKQAEPLPMQRQEQAPLSKRAKAVAPATSYGDGNHAGGDERRFVEMALDYIASDNRDTWLKIGGALHDSGEPWARAVWDEWSRRSSKFNATDQAKTWTSFDRPTGRKATTATIIHEARQNGFTGTKHEPPPEVPPEYLKMAQGFMGKLRGASEPGDDDRLDNSGGDEGGDGNISGVWFDGDAAPEPVPTIVDELIPARGLTFGGGQSGSGKSFVAIDLGVALATNQPFCGRDTEERLGVIFVAAEGGDTISPRLAAAKIGRDVKEKIPFAVIRDAPDLAVDRDRAAFIVKLGKVAKRLQAQFGVRVGLVVLDTLAACFRIKDENAAGEMNAVCKAAAQLGDALGAATFVVAHYGKDQSTGLRGSSALRGAGESVLAVLCERNDNTGEVKNRRLVHVKSRSGPEGAMFHFDLEHVHLGFDTKGRPFGAAKVVAKEGDKAGGKSRRLARGEKVYLDALSLRTDQAEKIRPFGYEGPEVPAVDREAVRAEFNAAYVVDGDDEATRKATKQKAFKRSEDGLLNRKAICTRELNGKSYVWLVSEPDAPDTDNGQGAPL